MFDSRQGQKNSTFSTASRPALEPLKWDRAFSTHQYCVPQTLSPGVKWLRRKADHLPPSSAEVKHVRNYTSISPHIFMVWYVKLCIGTTLYFTSLLSHIIISAQYNCRVMNKPLWQTFREAPRLLDMWTVPTYSEVVFIFIYTVYCI
jgi:hypothetical protein